jgi:hypothetical protein
MRSTFALLDCVEAQLFWMLKFAEESHAPRERLESLNNLMSRTRAALQELYALETNPAISDAILQDKPSDKDFTEPPRRFCYTLGTG